MCGKSDWLIFPKYFKKMSYGNGGAYFKDNKCKCFVRNFFIDLSFILIKTHIRYKYDFLHVFLKDSQSSKIQVQKYLRITRDFYR